MIGPKIGLKKSHGGFIKTVRYSSGQVIPNGDWDADARATSQFRPGHGAGASGMQPTVLLLWNLSNHSREFQEHPLSVL
jgi:hypothetical protein